MFDNQSVSYLLLPAMVAASLAQLVSWRINRDTPGVGWWAFGLTLQAASMAFRVEVGAWPYNLHMMLPISAMVAGQFILLLGLCRFTGRPMYWRTCAVTMTALVVGLVCALAIWPSFAASTFVFAVAISVPLGLQFSLLPPIARREGFAAVVVLIAACSLTLAIVLLRAALLAVYGEQMMGSVQLGSNLSLFGRQAATSIIATLIGTAYSYGYVLLVTSRTHWRLEQMAIVDALTGAANRRAFDAEFARAQARAHRAGTRLGLAVMDLDRFKQVNDTRGHEAGDALLRHFANLVRARMRQTDFFARVGGEEFVLLLAEATMESAEHAAERIRAALAESSLDLPGGALRGTVSIGIAVSESGAGDAGRLYALADEALYRAKSLGRNRVERAAMLVTATIRPASLRARAGN